jgi:putative ABC transport system permease protein
MIIRECWDAWRRLSRRPGYTALSVMVLGVGLGVVIFVFSLVNTLMLQPLPFPHAERLVVIGELQHGGGSVGDTGIGIGDLDSDRYLHLKASLHSVDDIGAYRAIGSTLDGGSGANYYESSLMTSSMMGLLGVQPLLGRGFTADDDQPDAAKTLLIGEDLWRHAFNADPHIIGRVVHVNGELATVIGVLPADFCFPGYSQVWLPLRVEAGKHDGIFMVARRQANIGLGQAQQELKALDKDWLLQLPHGDDERPLVMKPQALSFVSENIRRWVWLMFGACVLVLLLACINVANLQLVQTLNRRRELALRSALGSNPMRLMTGALAESLLLSMAALLLALPIAQAGNRWLVAIYAAHDETPSSYLHFGINGWVLVFAIFAALVSTALAGVIPAWRASRADLQDALRDGAKGSGGGFARLARILVIAEVALTVVLLVGAGTFVRALHDLLEQPEMGAAYAENVLTADVKLPSSLYLDDGQRIRFFDTAVERLRHDPDVIDATASNTVPGARLGSHEYVAVPGQPRPTDGWPEVQMGIVDSHFLDTYGVHLIEGRFFDARDRAGSAQVVAIDSKMAAAFWPHLDPLGQHLILYPGESSALTVTVIGVIEPLQLDSAMEISLPGLLMPLPQAAGAMPLHGAGLAVHTHVRAAAYTQRLIELVRSVDPQAAVYAVHTQSRGMAMGRVGIMVLTEVFSALGLVALLLAAAGLYGVLAFSVAQRTREIGIRRAIGAGHGAILRDAGRQLIWQLGIGLGIGIALALPWSHLLADPNLHTRSHDPAVFVPVLLLVMSVAVFASLAPLYRALRVDPAIALDDE